MTVRIVGVHGVGNYRPGLSPEAAAEKLGRQWADQLRRGSNYPADALDVRMAYYAPHLNTIIRQGSDGLDDLPADIREMIRIWATQLAPPSEDIPEGYVTVPIRLVVDRIARLHHLNRALLRPFVAIFFREVATYLRQPDSATRRAVRDTVANAIARHRPRIVIAHSLGSIVAYETLWANPELQLELFITLGSPLGMPEVIFERLQPTPSCRGNRPPGVRRWVNIADSGDIVAIPRPFTLRFDPNKNIERQIGLIDFHTASNYLACRDTSTAITAHLS